MKKGTGSMEEHYEMLRKVSRTFALSIEQLPLVLRDSITIAYLLFRVSDCLEDTEGIPPERKAELLRLWAQVLEGDKPVVALTDCIADWDSSDPEIAVAQNAGFVLQQLDGLPSEIQTAVLHHVHATSLGMARWQEHGPYVEDEAALDDYMHEVAGRVGYLLTDIFSWYSPAVRARREQLMPLSRECGLALQTVNVIRGMHKDYERGWVFVPRTFYERFGLTRDSLFDPANLGRALKVVDLLSDKAERHLANGLCYVTTIPRHLHSIRLAAIWPVFFAVKTLAISRNNVNVLLSEAKIGRDQVKRIILNTKLLGWSNRWLAFYYDLLARAY